MSLQPNSPRERRPVSYLLGQALAWVAVGAIAAIAVLVVALLVHIAALAFGVPVMAVVWPLLAVVALAVALGLVSVR